MKLKSSRLMLAKATKTPQLNEIIRVKHQHLIQPEDMVKNYVNNIKHGTA